ncbi:MAG: hypothetical protein J3K34DRAFT_399910 [Monoraphidium minutum]|nr:MAG: hypothetical protein J3K34DRAFT_399910 [Monoraphidium minutum]
MDHDSVWQRAEARMRARGGRDPARPAGPLKQRAPTACRGSPPPPRSSPLLPAPPSPCGAAAPRLRLAPDCTLLFPRPTWVCTPAPARCVPFFRWAPSPPPTGLYHHLRLRAAYAPPPPSSVGRGARPPCRHGGQRRRAAPCARGGDRCEARSCAAGAMGRRARRPPGSLPGARRPLQRSGVGSCDPVRAAGWERRPPLGRAWQFGLLYWPAAVISAPFIHTHFWPVSARAVQQRRRRRPAARPPRCRSPTLLPPIGMYTSHPPPGLARRAGCAPHL